MKRDFKMKCDAFTLPAIYAGRLILATAPTVESKPVAISIRYLNFVNCKVLVRRRRNIP